MSLGGARRSIVPGHMKQIIAAISIATALALGAGTSVWAAEENEQTLNASDVPQAVQDAAHKEGGKILRWEKEGGNYEAVIQKKGKEWGVEISPEGKVMSRHNERKEHKEKHE